jgi:hypothetical protein
MYRDINQERMVRIPGEVARESAMMSPTIPI